MSRRDSAESKRVVVDTVLLVHMTEPPWRADFPGLFGVPAIELAITDAVMREMDALAKNYSRPSRLQQRARERRDALVAHFTKVRPLETRTGVSVVGLLPTEGSGDDALISLVRKENKLSLATDDGLLVVRAAAWGVDAKLVPAEWLTVFEARDWQPKLTALETMVAELRNRVMPEPALSIVGSDGRAVIGHSWQRVKQPSDAEILRDANEVTAKWMDSQKLGPNRTKMQLRDLMARREVHLKNEVEQARKRARDAMLHATRLAFVPMLRNAGTAQATDVRIELSKPDGAHTMMLSSLTEARHIENGSHTCAAVVSAVNAGDDMPIAQIQLYWSNEEPRDVALNYRVTAQQLRAPVMGTVTIELRPT